MFDPFWRRFSNFGYLVIIMAGPLSALEVRVMMIRDEAPVIGRGGVLAATGAAGIILAEYMRLMSGGPPGWPVIVAAWLAAGAMILVLCRTAMPPQLRGPLVFALIAMMFLGVARADLFGVHKVGDQMAQGVDQAAQGRAALDSYATGVAPSSSDGGEGADVNLVAGRSDGSDWARDINAALRGRIGGHAARDIRIDGWVDEEGLEGGLTRVEVDWGITHDFATQRCGHTSSAGRDRTIMIQAIAEPMVQAIKRTVGEGKATCP